MKKLFQIFILFSFVLNFTNCKKKKDPQPEIEPTTCTYSSIFGIVQNYSVLNNTLVLNGRNPDFDILAYCPNSKGPTSVKIESLSFNSTPLQFVYAAYWTLPGTDTLPQNAFPPYIWNIHGTPDYPSFSETVVDSIPQFTKYNMMPDSMSKSGSTVLQLGSRNATDIFVYIDNNGLPLPAPIAYGFYSCGPVAANANSMTLNYDPSITSVSTCSLAVKYSKKYSKTIDGRQIYFTLSSIYRKKIKFYN